MVLAVTAVIVLGLVVLASDRMVDDVQTPTVNNRLFTRSL
jgi:hypothetical protein